MKEGIIMDKPKYIVKASYLLYKGSVSISRYKLESESKIYYHAVDEYRNRCSFLKDDIGKPILRNESSAACEVSVFMIDADNDTLIKLLCKWFTDKAQEIMKIKVDIE